jgi:hypothetical protein
VVLAREIDGAVFDARNLKASAPGGQVESGEI